MAQEYKYVGKRGIRRYDGDDKAKGAAEFTVDIKLPGMSYARVLTCPYAHAKIKSMDSSKAEALPGVRYVLRYDDPDLPKGMESPGRRGVPLYLLDDEAFIEGYPLGAMVAADTLDIADEALTLLDIEWEELPHVMDPLIALEPDAPIVYPDYAFNQDIDPTTTNLKDERVWELQGNVEEGFAEADKVIDFDFYVGEITSMGPEVCSCVAKWTGDVLAIWLHFQNTSSQKRRLSSLLNIPQAKIDLHMAYQGGQFGGWNWSGTTARAVLDPLTAIIAKRTGLPVKTVFTRKDDFGFGGMEHGYYHVEVGFKDDGTITAVKTDNIYPIGLDSGTWGAGIGHFDENSRIPNLAGRGRSVWVNKHSMGSPRCEQKPACYTLTMVLNHVAAELGMDPCEIALKMDGSCGKDMTHLSEIKKKFNYPDRDSLRECMDAGKTEIDWDNKWHLAGTRELPNGRMHGMTMTYDHEWGAPVSPGLGTPGLLLEMDGKLNIIAQMGDVGQNCQTSYAQVAAEEMGMLIEDVYFNYPDKEKDTPWEIPSFGGSTYMAGVGWALRIACRALKQKIFEVVTSEIPRSRGRVYAPDFPNYKPEDLDIKDSVIYVKADPSVSLPLAQSRCRGHCAYTHRTMADNQLSSYGPVDVPENQGVRGTYVFCRQAHFMEVEVDTETGEVEVTKLVVVNDAGQAITPESFEGQAYGGAIMGLSWGRNEDILYCPQTGVMLNSNMYDFKVATIIDSGPIVNITVETGMGNGPFGDNGIGEDNASTVPPMIACAIYNAIGKWVDFPTTPEKVLKALGKA